MSSLDQIVAPIAKEFAHVKESLREVIVSQYPALGDVSRTLLAQRGKMMRPMLTLLTAKLLAKSGEEVQREEENKAKNSMQRSEYVAIMIELIHNATLIHDDVIDEAYTRHGELTLGALIRSRSAVLAGDYLFSRGLSIASKIKAYKELDIAIEAIEALVEGELRQAKNAQKMVVSGDEYFEVIRLKTASLIVAAAKCGAVSVGATDKEIETMAQFAHKVGIAFQIQDDILDYTSDSTGKPRYNDIAERKITLPLLLSIEEGGTSILKELRNGKIASVANFVARYKGVEKSTDENRRIIAEAVALLDQFADCEVRQSLKQLAQFAAVREK